METDLRSWGFSDWFERQNAENPRPEFELARVIAADRDRCLVAGRQGEIPAELSGRMLYGAGGSLDYPAVGDWVYVQYYDGDSHAVIYDLFPRKTLLKRKTAGSKIEYQLIAANVDLAFIVQSLDSNYNPARMERYQAAVTESGIEPMVLLSKSDLPSPEQVRQKVNEVEKNLELKAVAFSNRSGEGLEQISDLIAPAGTCCLLGSSGVGKSSLINRLLGEQRQRTGEIRRDGKGRHSTARRELIVLHNGGLLIDTPGMRELGQIELDRGLLQTFSDIETLASGCRFSNCAHIREPGCAVLSAVERGEVSAARYRSYMKLRKESDYHSRSYLEKRKKDRAFGRMVKQIMNQKRSE